MYQVERAGEEQAGSKACLEAAPLLTEDAGHFCGGIKKKTAAGNDERNGEAAKQGQKNPDGAIRDQSSTPEAFGLFHGTGMQLVHGGNECCNQNRSYIQSHPKLDCCTVAAGSFGYPAS